MRGRGRKRCAAGSAQRLALPADSAAAAARRYWPRPHRSAPAPERNSRPSLMPHARRLPRRRAGCSQPRRLVTTAAAGRARSRDHGRRDRARSAHRVARPVKIVRRDRGVDGKAAFPRRQPVVAPLRGQYAHQLPIAGKALQHLARGLSCPAHVRRAHQAAGQRRHRRRNRLLRIVESARAVAGLHRCDIPVDGPALARELLPSGPPGSAPARRQSRTSGRRSGCGRRHPASAAIARSPAVTWSKARRDRGALILHLPDVMQPHVPLVSRPMKRVRESARLVVPLQHQHPLAARALPAGPPP